MIEIKVDDYTFYLSRRTLDRFPETKLHRMLTREELHSNFIEKRGSYYIVDADPVVFSTLVRLMRGVVFWDEQMNQRNQLSDLCILLDIDFGYLRSRNTANTRNNSPIDKEVNIEETAYHADDTCFGENIFERTHSTPVHIEPRINKRTVIRSRKIELDTHNEMINL